LALATTVGAFVIMLRDSSPLGSLYSVAPKQ
jgi:hypothetical protein